MIHGGHRRNEGVVVSASSRIGPLSSTEADMSTTSYRRNEPGFRPQSDRTPAVLSGGRPESCMHNYGSTWRRSRCNNAYGKRFLCQMT